MHPDQAAIAAAFTAWRTAQDALKAADAALERAPC
jgi:hypothetical protein